ncbi:MAG: MFS transporter [Candidatus Thorarchaeota archaeon]
MQRQQETSPGWGSIILGTSFGIFLSALDSSIVNVSLVTIAGSLSVDMASIQWVILAYLLIITSLMPLMGKFGDRYGKTFVFQTGMIVFIVGSLFCAFSPTLSFLVASRVFQAIGAAMMSANGLAIVTYFTTPENRGRAIGTNSVVLAVALAVGPVLGGILSEFFGWASIFLVNLPIGIIGFIAVSKLIPQTERIQETKFDTIGAVLFFLLLFLFVYTVSALTSLESWMILLLVGATIASFVGLIYRERTFVSPIIPTRVLADRRISASVFSAILAYFGMIPVTFLFPFFLQEAMGFSQSVTGILMITHPLTIFATGPIAGYVSERVNGNVQTTLGLLIETIGLVFIATSIPNVPFMLIGIIIMGSGLSFFSVANGNFVMTSAPKQYMGVVSALTNIARTTGFSISTAIATTIFSYFFLVLNPGGEIAGAVFFAAYAGAYQIAIYSTCALVLIAAFISAFRGLSPSEVLLERNDSQLVIFEHEQAND